MTAVTITRPNDTTAYTAGDVVGTAFRIDGMGPGQGGEVMITSAAFEVDVNAVPSGMSSFRLYLYNVTPPSAPADNSVWDLPSGDRPSFLGFVDLGSPADLGSTLYVEANSINKQVTLTTGGALYGVLVTNGAWTPAALTVFVVTLHATGV